MLPTHRIAGSLEEIKELLPIRLPVRTNWRLRNWSCQKRPPMWARPFRWYCELVSIHERESWAENRLILAGRDSRSKNSAKKIEILRRSAAVAISSIAIRAQFPQHGPGISSSARSKRRHWFLRHAAAPECGACHLILLTATILLRIHSLAIHSAC